MLVLALSRQMIDVKLGKWLVFKLRVSFFCYSRVATKDCDGRAPRVSTSSVVWSIHLSKIKLCLLCFDEDQKIVSVVMISLKREREIEVDDDDDEVGGKFIYF